MKTLEDCQREVAQKHRIGNGLVTGHKKSYFDEATQLYVSQFYSEERVKLMTAMSMGEGRCKDSLWSQWWEDVKGLV